MKRTPFLVCTVMMRRDEEQTIHARWDTVMAIDGSLAKQQLLTGISYELRDCAAVSQYAIPLASGPSHYPLSISHAEFFSSPYGMKCKMVYEFMVWALNSLGFKFADTPGEKYQIAINLLAKYYDLTESDVTSMMSDYLSLVTSMCRLELKSRYAITFNTAEEARRSRSSDSYDIHKTIAVVPFEAEDFRTLVNNDVPSVQQLLNIRDEYHLRKLLQHIDDSQVDRIWDTVKFCVLIPKDLKGIIFDD